MHLLYSVSSGSVSAAILGVIELRPNFGKLNDVAVAADFCKRTFAQKV
jgi:hypothetical protein